VVFAKSPWKTYISTLKRMFDDFPKDLAKEWKLEMEARKRLSHNALTIHKYVTSMLGVSLNYNTKFFVVSWPIKVFVHI
jgi:hypothetical protein